MRIFSSQNSRVLLVDKVIEVKIRFVGESHVSNIEFTVIHKLQHGACENVMCINGIWTEELIILDFIQEHLKGVSYVTVSAQYSEFSTRGNRAYGSPGSLVNNLLYDFSIRFCN